MKSLLQDRRLSSVNAVKDRRVYYTFGFWYWWDPTEVLVEIFYLPRLFYPERFPEFHIENTGNEVFYKFYGMDNGFSALSRILNCGEWLDD